MPWQKQWSEDEEETLVEMWQDGYTASEIANALDKYTHQVRMFVSRNRERLNLENRGTALYRQEKRTMSDLEFDKLWKGSVPFGHWATTKPWRLS
jgi:hypothetical protein